MEWAAVINNPLLKNLPFKIELNKWGQILMSPASNSHGNLQYKTGSRIEPEKRGKGEIITEFSVQTSQGVKVADVAWVSDEFIEKYDFETPYSCAPEICVEIVSPSNPKEEIEEKIELYLAKEAREIWIVSDDGNTRYYSYKGELSQSVELDIDK
ncbi:Uma2 family endonuclease [Ectothiorhodospiraceae bacterium BW-2]|nr:Uma2 family endonuclease [Ectothiorhodospiraceae bacterium BW-2]